MERETVRERKPMSREMSLNGKVVLLTGANSGIGRATAIGVARLGASLVIACRSESRGRRAVDEIADRSGSDRIELITEDLESSARVRRIADEFKERHSRLDVLINNAGTNIPHYQETSEGIEKTMAVNYLAPFLLTNLLLDTLVKSARSRIINVASASHFRADLDIGNLTHDRRHGLFGLSAYGRSKLALILFTYELARRLDGNGVTVNCLHPGAVRTRIWRHAGAASPLSMLMSLFLKSPRSGAETSIFLASSPSVEGVTGRYFVDCREQLSSSATYDVNTARRLWDASVQATGLSE